MSLEFNITDNSPRVLSELPDAIERALEAIGLQAEGYAKVELSNTPKRIDTGLLRNSITHAVSGKPAAISSYKGSKTHTAESESAKKRGIVGKAAPPPRSGTYEGQAPDEREKANKKGRSNIPFTYTPLPCQKGKSAGVILLI